MSAQSFPPLAISSGKGRFGVQSTLFRLISTVVTVVLLFGLVLAVLLVLRSTPTPVRPVALSQRVRSTTVSFTPTPVDTPALALAATSAAAPVTVAGTPVATSSLSITVTPRVTVATTTAVGRTTTRVTPPPTPTSTKTPAPRATATPAILRPTPTATSVIALKQALDLRELPAAGWHVFSNANQVNDVMVLNTTIWGATDGGIVAWNRSTNEAIKYTTLDGLVANRTTAVVNCPLAGFGIVFGTAQGLQIFDSERASWKLLNSTNSDMHFDDVATLVCNAEAGFLVVGYRQHGLDLFDRKSGEWRLLDRDAGLQRTLVDAVAVVGNLDEIWVSSGFGISVLTADGARFYDKNNTPLETNQINVMVSDAAGAVWLGTRDKVYKIAGEEWTIYSPSYVLASNFPTGEITSLAFANDGALWIGSDQGQLCKFDPVIINCDPFFAGADSGIQSAIHGLTLDNLGRLYVATANDGVRLYDGKDWRAFTVADDQLASNQIRALTQDQLGYLWLATDVGLQQLNPTDFAQQRLFADSNNYNGLMDVVALLADPKAGIWLGGRNAAYFGGDDWVTFTESDGLVDSRVRALVIDDQQRTWLGTQRGLSIWNGDSFFNLGTEDGLPGELINTLFADGETVWIGSNRGLLRFTGNRLQIFTTTNSGLPGNEIRALVKGADGALLVGTNLGVARLAGENFSPIPETIGAEVNALAVTPDRAIWVGTQGNGLLYFDGLRWGAPPQTDYPPTGPITTLFVDQQGTLWIGGPEGGLLRYVP